MLAQPMPSIRLYVDGSYSPRGSAVGVVILGTDFRREYAQRVAARDSLEAELLAAIVGLKQLRDPSLVHVYSDSTLLIAGMRGGIRPETILWQQLDNRAARHCVRWWWLKGHAGDMNNERAHFLAYGVCLEGC